VLAALFGEQIRKMLFKPDLRISAGTKAPYFEKTAEKNTSSGSNPNRNYFGKIKIKITNTNATVSESCKIFAERIYRKKADGRTYDLLKEFQPTPFVWLGEENELNSRDVVCGIPNYVEFAQIRREEPLTSSEENVSPAVRKYRISLPIDDPENEGAFISLEDGAYIIPLTLHSKNLGKPVIKYLYLYWNGASPENIVSADIEISIMSDREARESLNK